MNPLSAVRRLFALAKSIGLPRVLLAAMLVLVSLPAKADSTVYTDVPLRTKNRAKPNILMMLDNGGRSYDTYSPDSFPGSLNKTPATVCSSLTKCVNDGSGTFKTSVYFQFDYCRTSNDPSKHCGSDALLVNSFSQGDDDWHFRASDCTVSGSGSSQVVTCPTGATPFNRLYFNAALTYTAPKAVDTSNGNLPLPADVAAHPNTYAWYVTGVMLTDGTLSAVGATSTAAALNPQTSSSSPLYGCTLGNPSIDTNTSWKYDNITMSDASGSKGTPLLSGDSVAINAFDTCAWRDGYNPSLGTVNLLRGYAVSPYPFDDTMMPPQNIPKLLSGGNPTEVVRPDGSVLTLASIPSQFVDNEGTPAPGYCGASTTTGRLVVCGPGWKPVSSDSYTTCSSATSSATTPYNSIYNPINNDFTPVTDITKSYTLWFWNNCSTLNTGGTLTGPFALGGTSTSAIATWVSPYYCDLAQVPKQSWMISGSSVGNYLPCTASTGTIWANPGPADYFDTSGNRYPIVDWYCNGFLHSGGNANCGNGNGTNDKFQIVWSKATIQKFATWHSFFRSRLLTVKTALGTAVDNANLDSNFRVGLASTFSGGGSMSTLGASTTESSHYFSAVADFDTTHKKEWFERMQRSQFRSQNFVDYASSLHEAYLWMTGTWPDPALPATSSPATGQAFLTQSAANTTSNTGADSQYVYYTDVNGARQLVGRNGPMMYSCQSNVLVFVSGGISGKTNAPFVPVIGGSGACADSYRGGDTSGSLTRNSYVKSGLCDVDAGAVALPSYLAPSAGPGFFYDATACKSSDTGACTGVNINYNDTNWPAPFRAPSGVHYNDNSNPQNSIGQMALYYWSRDLNEEFNRQKGSTLVSVDYPHFSATGLPTGSGKLGVPSFGNDNAYWPHVTTYIVNLGTAGTYDYMSTSTSNPIVKAGTSGHLNWPTPSFLLTTPPYTSLDDMAHAAVAGHGKFLSAFDSTTLNTAFGTLFTDILQLSGSESAVAVANTQVSQTGTSYAFQSSYNTSGWWGDLVASPISSSTGAITTYTLAAAVTTPVTSCTAGAGSTTGWSAMCQLRNTLCPSYLPSNACAAVPGANNATARIIVTNKVDGVGIPFTYSNLNTAGLASQFKLYTTDGSSAATYLRSDSANATSVISYLRGDATNENCTSTTTTYRCRYRNGNSINYWYPLGDVVDAEAVVIGPPQTSYDDTNDPGYSVWKATMATRSSVVFQAANDGFLHAFLVSTGAENWAYAPGYVLSSLKQLASPSYSHQYYVNATPTFGDVYYSSAWHTILVGGLGKGGRGYYALDVTTPTASSESDAASKVLWVFPKADGSSDVSGVCVNTAANVGYTYGRPAIVKISVNDVPTWVVLLASGYNNSDGIAHLYVVDAATGTCLKDISTTTGSGMAHLAAKVVNTGTDLTVQSVYAGDLNGNVWKFGPVAPATSTNLSTWTASLFAILKDSSASHKLQPVTSEPNIAQIGSTTMVFVGTGRYLGTNDVPASDNYKTETNAAGANVYVAQSMYGLMDDGVTYTNSTSGARASMTSTNIINADCTDSGGSAVAASSCGFSSSYCAVPSSTTRCFNPTLQAALAAQNSVHPWVLDLPAGERVITNPVIALGALLFTSNQPVADPCQPGGKSFFYMLNYETGGMPSGAASIAQSILDPITGDNVMASRPTLIQLADGRVIGLVSTSVGATLQISNILSQSARRVSWREVPN